MADEGWRLIAACRRRYLVSLLHRRSVRLLDARSHARGEAGADLAPFRIWVRTWIGFWGGLHWVEAARRSRDVVRRRSGPRRRSNAGIAVGGAVLMGLVKHGGLGLGIFRWFYWFLGSFSCLDGCVCGSFSFAMKAEPIANRVMASIPEPLFGGRINVVQSYGPDTLAEAAVAGASKRTLPDTPLFGGRINVVQSYGPDTLAGAEKACL